MPTLKQCYNTLLNPSLTLANPLSQSSFGHHLNHHFTAHFDVCLLGDAGVDFSIPLHFISTFRSIGSHGNWRRKQPNKKCNKNMKNTHGWKQNSSLTTTTSTMWKRLNSKRNSFLSSSWGPNPLKNLWKSKQ